MAEEDLLHFFDKVEQLRELVDSLENDSNRRAQLAACLNHNQVVRLAKSWGYEIGRRWGEPLQVEEHLSENNLLGQAIPFSGHERRLLIKQGSGWRLEAVFSCGAFSPDGFWYDHSEHEWILLLRGSASLRMQNPSTLIHLNVGDQFCFSPHQLHRVESTDPSPGTVWLALFWNE